MQQATSSVQHHDRATALFEMAITLYPGARARIWLEREAKRHIALAMQTPVADWVPLSGRRRASIVTGFGPGGPRTS